MPFWSLIVLQVAVFVVLVVVLLRVLGRHFQSASVHLQGLNAEYVRRHEELKKQLAEAQSQYSAQMTKAKTEGEQLVTRAKQEAESLRSRLLQDARTDSERIVQQGHETRDAMRQELEHTMNERAIQRACELLQDTLPETMRRQLQAQWLQELLTHGFTQLQHVSNDASLEEAHVVSAFALTPSERAEVQEHLSKALGHPVQLSEAVDERLIAGLTITLGSLVLDGSIASRIQQAARAAQRVP